MCDQYVGVSTTTRPVTQTADVAVKSAVRGDAPSAPARETGRARRTVPTRMASAKARTTS
jgi:hypothetical protein